MQKAIESKIEELLKGRFEETSCFIVEIKVRKGGREIQVFVDDSEKNIAIGLCADLNRHLKRELERAALYNDQSSLEVSSPGMDNPFKVFQQYNKSIGKKVEVLLLSGEKLEGVLKSVEEEELVLEQHKPNKNKKNKQVQIEERTLQFQDIKYTKKYFSF